MQSTGLPPAQLVTNPEQLSALLQKLEREPVIAVDTESNSLHAYQERVCLIQFSTPTEDFLLDPIAVGDLSSLAPIFENPEIVKIFHAAEYDLICLKRDFGFGCQNLFDTMLAARILGWPKVGLGSILQAHFGVKLEKSNQRADWGVRPLPKYLLKYAQLDTHFLIRMRNIQIEKLKERKVWELAVEDFRRACHVNIPEKNSKENMCWRINGSHDLSPQNVAILQELCIYRDKMGKKFNRPLFKILSNRTLLEAATLMPGSFRDLHEIHGMTPGQVRRYGKGILDAVRRGRQAKPIYFPRKKRPNNQYIHRSEALHNWRKVRARSVGVESDVVMPKDLLREIAAKNPSQGPELAEILEEVPWRYKQYGGEIIALLESINRNESSIRS